MPATNFFGKYKNKFFVETGSLIGDGISQALNQGFENILSIELSDKYFNICKNKFKNHKNVKIIKGDSAFVLYDSIKDINDPITFWLDGHHSCADTALGKYWSPLMQELDQISKHHLSKSHTIMIDDMRCWEKLNPVCGFCKNDIFAKLNVNDCEFIYENGFVKDDVLVIVPK